MGAVIPQSERFVVPQSPAVSENGSQLSFCSSTPNKNVSQTILFFLIAKQAITFLFSVAFSHLGSRTKEKETAIHSKIQLKSKRQFCKHRRTSSRTSPGKNG